MCSARTPIFLLLLALSSACVGCSSPPETTGTWTVKIVPFEAWNHEQSWKLAVAEIESGTTIDNRVVPKLSVRSAVLAVEGGNSILYSKELGRGEYLVHGTARFMDPEVGYYDVGIRGFPNTGGGGPVIEVDWIKRLE